MFSSSFEETNLSLHSIYLFVLDNKVTQTLCLIYNHNLGLLLLVLVQAF